MLDRKSVRPSSILIYVFVAATLAFTPACGGKRRPVVAGPGTAQPVEGQGSDTWNVPPRDAGSGDGIQPVPGEGGIGSDLPSASGLTGEEASPLADVHFDYDSAALTSDAQGVLQKHAAWMQSRAGVQFVLEGHCDERGTVEYNLILGEQRARAVYDYLTSLGVPASRLSTVSLGKERPLDQGHSESAWARNRRVHFAVSG